MSNCGDLFSVSPDGAGRGEYPDDFEEEEEEDAMGVVHSARAALALTVDRCGDVLEEECHLRDAGGWPVTLKTLREKCIMGKQHIIHTPGRNE